MTDYEFWQMIVEKKHKFAKGDLVLVAVDGLDIPKGTLCYIQDIDESDDEYPYRVVVDGVEFDRTVISPLNWEYCAEEELKVFDDGRECVR